MSEKIYTIEYIDKALRYTEGCDFQSFSSNEEKVEILEKWISRFGTNKIARRKILYEI